MKTTTADITVESTLTGNEIAMSLDENSTAHLMGLFIDLYADRITAVIREYSTNGYDSHIEAGVDRPIEITLPTAWEPQLRIRDYGIGMSESDIVDVYSKYGASTKRDTDDQVGMLGLGCKSALTYTNQFTVVGIKYGVKTTVAISREDNGGGSMVVMDPVQTDEPTGVEIVIPVNGNDIRSFKEKAAKFFRFWQPGTVLVDGVQPESLEGLRVEDDLIVVKGDQDYVVMGNVAYPHDLNVGLRHGYALVAYVPIGAVNFPPPRESLMDTKTTRESIEMIQNVFSSHVNLVIQKEIDACQTPGGALRVMMEWRKVLDGRTHTKTFSYRGNDVPEFIQGRFCVTSQDSYKLSSHNWFNQVATEYVASALFVKNYKPTGFTASHKKKLNLYQEQNGLDFNNYVLADAEFTDQWFEGATIVDWAEISKLKIPTKRRYSRTGVAKPTGSYKKAYVNGQYVDTLVAADIDTSKPIFYTTGEVFFNCSHEAIATHKPGGFTYVFLTPNRVNKFCRDFPKAKEPNEFLRKLVERKAKKITREDMYLEAVRQNARRTCLEYIDADRVLDPAIKHARELMSAPRSARMVAWDKIDHLASYVRADVNLPTVEWEDPLEAYTLIPERYYLKRTDMNHIYLYMNALFTDATN